MINMICLWTILAQIPSIITQAEFEDCQFNYGWGYFWLNIFVSLYASAVTGLNLLKTCLWWQLGANQTLPDLQNGVFKAN